MNLTQKILLAAGMTMIFILPLFIMFDEKGFMDLCLLKQKKNNLIEMNAKLEQENIRLQRFVGRLKQNDPALVEQIAQDELGMVGKSEFVLIPGRLMNNR